MSLIKYLVVSNTCREKEKAVISETAVAMYKNVTEKGMKFEKCFKWTSKQSLDFFNVKMFLRSHLYCGIIMYPV